MPGARRPHCRGISPVQMEKARREHCRLLAERKSLGQRKPDGRRSERRRPRRRSNVLSTDKNTTIGAFITVRKLRRLRQIWKEHHKLSMLKIQFSVAEYLNRPPLRGASRPKRRRW